MSVLSEVVRTFEVPKDLKITTEEYFTRAGVKYMGSNFKSQFLDLPIPELRKTKLAVRNLETRSVDKSILKKLGKKAKISISQFHAFLSDNRESKGWFIFYIEEKDGNLWAVFAYWFFDDGGWCVGASPLTRPDGWPAGYRVVSQV